jgi:uncharacterized RDD family membrane protein YckC
MDTETGQFEFDEQAPAGYLSEEHKRKFTIMAGVLGALFFIAQFIVPIVVMLAIMPFGFFGGGLSIKIVEPEKSALLGDSLWYVETRLSAEPESENELSVLKRLPLFDEGDPEEVAPLLSERPWLLSSDRRLWILSPSMAAYFEDGRMVPVLDEKVLGDIAQPFLFRGNPSVIQDRPEGLAWMVLRNGTWEKEADLSLGLQEDICCIQHNLQILCAWDRLHVFLKYGDTLYYGDGLPLEGEDEESFWRPVADAGHEWRAALIAGEPALFFLKQGEGTSTDVLGMIRQNGSWKTFFEHSLGMTMDLGVHPMGNGDRLLLVSQSFPGSLRIVQAGPEGVIHKRRFGRGFPFEGFMMGMMFLPHAGTLVMPFILAAILTMLMRRHRVCEHREGARTVPMASLIRRALAQILDAVVLAVPLIACGASVFLLDVAFEDLIGFSSGFMHVLFIFLGMLAWVVLCLLGYSIMEGRWGVTPGKWAVGIRVLGTNLAPCGFGRAVVRNLLKFLDGFFNFMIGIMVVALSEKWQRIGDMAARTVVVRVR